MAAVALLVSGAAASAQDGARGLAPQGGDPADRTPSVLEGVRFDQRLDETLPLDLTFRDEDGRDVRLGEYFGERPVILAFVYYECPMLCTQVLNGLGSTLSTLTETVGREFDVVAVSFDPRETPVMAAAKKKVYLDRYDRAGAERGWHFLTGDEASIRALTAAAGFGYVWDEQSQQYAHPSGIVVTTPEGRLARYFFGIEYAPRDVRFALMESSAGRIGSAVDKLLLYCYHYDPARGGYSFVAMNAVRLGGAVTLVLLAGFVVLAIRREQRAG